MKRIIIIAVLAYLVYYLYNKKNTVALVSKKGPKNNLDLIFVELDSAVEAVTPMKTVIDPSPAEPSLVDPVGTSNANIAALTGLDLDLIKMKSQFKESLFRPENWTYANPIIEERTPSSTGDTPYWMPNGEEMIYPRGLEYSIAAQYGNF